MLLPVNAGGREMTCETNLYLQRSTGFLKTWRILHSSGDKVNAGLRRIMGVFSLLIRSAR